MISEDLQKIINDIRTGEIDINNQSLFLPIVIKGLILRLKEQLIVRGAAIPHFIIHTGDDTMYLSVKGQNASIEPLEISNEDYVYNSVPRCIVKVNGLTLESDQLTSPYTYGQIQYESEDNVYTLIGEFRRVPIKLSIDCKYYVDSWGDLMELTQQIISKLAFVQTYNVSYMGQMIKCSYTIPTSLDNDYMMELDGTTQDNKLRTTELSFEIETNFPVWEPRTIVSSLERIVYISNDDITSVGPGGRNQDYVSGGTLAIRPQGYKPGPTQDTWISPGGEVVKIPEEAYEDKKPASLGKIIVKNR